MIKKIDIWVGKCLMQPLVIRACWLLRCSQHSLANHLDLVGWFALFWLMGKNGPVWATVLVGFWTLATMLAVVQSPDRVYPTNFFSRICWLAFSVDHTIAHVLGMRTLFANTDIDAGCLIAYAWMLEEYARTLDTLPPKPVKDKKASLKPATVLP